MIFKNTSYSDIRLFSQGRMHSLWYEYLGTSFNWSAGWQQSAALGNYVFATERWRGRCWSMSC